MDWCIGCGMCAQLCPYGNISMHDFAKPGFLPEPLAKIADGIGFITSKLLRKPATVTPPVAAKTPAAATPAAPPAKLTPDMLAQKAEERAVEIYSKVKTKATTCDLCTQLSTPSCVYACPHDAAKRVSPSKFFAKEIGRKSKSRRSLFTRVDPPSGDRTTH
jgi:Fe-S-cluster-containing hydrogenase component 2